MLLVTSNVPRVILVYQLMLLRVSDSPPKFSSMLHLFLLHILFKQWLLHRLC
jgi:hypothetical protein